MKYIGLISWLKPEEGGRTGQIPFNTYKYGPQIRYENSYGNWSIIINNYKKLDDFLTLATMQYLNVSNSPKDLVVGLKFELYEGSKKVAVGEIVDTID